MNPSWKTVAVVFLLWMKLLSKMNKLRKLSKNQSRWLTNNSTLRLILASSY